MNLKIRYFGMITEWAGTDSGTIEVNGNTIQDLKSVLMKSIPKLETITFQVAVNQSIASDETELNENDEVAVLPPFAGG